MPPTMSSSDTEAAPTATTGAAAGSSPPPAKKQKTCTSLPKIPPEAWSPVLEFAGGDMADVLRLCKGNTNLSKAINTWKCAICDDSIFVVPNSKDETKDTIPANDEGKTGTKAAGEAGTAANDGKNQANSTVAAKYDDKELIMLTIPNKTAPFFCTTCGDKSCGRSSWTCSGNKCPGCGEQECRKCMLDSIENCPMCSRLSASYCRSCQGACDQTCDLCRFPICDNHGSSCDKCGVTTCGIHDVSVEECSYCEKSYCPRCHGHGDGMFSCQSCRKSSCNAKGDNPSKGCPKFVFDEDYPRCEECDSKWAS